MAQKLTEQEQATVVELAKLLGKKLPSAHRSNAGGIASGLVRQRKRPLTEADVTAVLGKYGAGADELEALLAMDVLEPTEGGYLLSVPTHEDDPADEKDAPSPIDWQAASLLALATIALAGGALVLLVRRRRAATWEGAWRRLCRKAWRRGVRWDRSATEDVIAERICANLDDAQAAEVRRIARNACLERYS